MRGETRCIDGRLYRHDPQHDDPYLETDIGKCPECEGSGCDVEIKGVGRDAGNEKAIVLYFSRRLDDDEMRSLHEFAREWEA